MESPRFIAFYLPQYHPTASNDRWHGEGFTEWTNVRQSRKLFRGHQWPNEPGELGYYDLLSPQARQAQADLARQYGIEGFCYYHYWFGNGRRELELPFQQVLESGQPDFPFCLCWANQSWHKKFWTADGPTNKELLVEQTYPGDDITDHFYSCLPAFRDERYIRVDDKPLFMLYRPREHPQASRFISLWRTLAAENGLPGIHFIAQTEKLATDREDFLAMGFDGINSLRLFDYYKQQLSRGRRTLKKLLWALLRTPRVIPYALASRCFVSSEDHQPGIYPTLIPNWDHTPRSGRRGTVLSGTHPDLFRNHVKDALEAVRGRPRQQQLIFIKSWNEWGEGNYLEPDKRFGRAYLEALQQAIVESRESEKEAGESAEKSETQHSAFRNGS